MRILMFAVMLGSFAFVRPALLNFRITVKSSSNNTTNASTEESSEPLVKLQMWPDFPNPSESAESPSAKDPRPLNISLAAALVPQLGPSRSDTNASRQDVLLTLLGHALLPSLLNVISQQLLNPAVQRTAEQAQKLPTLQERIVQQLKSPVT